MEQRLLIAGMLEVFPAFRGTWQRFEEMSSPDEPLMTFVLGEAAVSVVQKASVSLSALEVDVILQWAEDVLETGPENERLLVETAFLEPLAATAAADPEKRWLLRRFGTRSRRLRDRSLRKVGYSDGQAQL